MRVLSITSASIAFLAATVFVRSADAAFVRAPWIQNADVTTITVEWEAGAAGGTQNLVWGLGNAMDQTAAGTLVSGTLYKATLTGLTGSSKYSYKVVSGADTGAPGTFVTAPAAAEPFRFAIYGDNRTNATPHGTVVAGIVQATPDFAINTGDLSDTGNYTEFMSIEEPLIANTPMFPVPGNHDSTSSFQYGFDRPNYYSFKWGNAFFIAISTDDSYAAGSPQLAWVDAQLTAANADPTVQWIFAYHHFPVYSSSSHGSTADQLTTLNPLYISHHVDAVFNGHDHNYERSEQDGVVYIVAGGGGAPLYSSGSTCTGHVFSQSVNSYVTVDLDGGKFHLKAWDANTNTMIDEKILDKGPATGVPTPTPEPTASGTPDPTGGNPASGDPTIHGSCGCDLSGAQNGDLASLAGATLSGLLAATAILRRRKT